MDLKPLVPLGAAFLGGVFSYLIVFKTQRITQKRERMQYQCSKLERGYLLVHALYDGHKAEIDKLASMGTMSGADWLKIRKHPGEAMSELKMIVAMYAPQLKPRLDTVNDVHQVLKKKFARIDKQARNNPGPPQTQSAPSAGFIRSVERDLKALGLRATRLKLGFVTGVQKMMEQYADSNDPGWTLDEA
jgi:hypothetical protein